MHDSFIWAEKYRPNNISQYAFQSETIQDWVSNTIAKGNMPHLLLSGAAGTGKSSLVNVLVKSLNIDDADYMEINASAKTSIDNIREEVMTFASNTPFGKFKVIVLEEADSISDEGQKALKLVVEQAGDCRFVFTTNELHKINEAIKSRCTCIAFTEPSKHQILEILLNIMVSESIDIVDPEDVAILIDQHYPDIRQTINALQYACSSGKFVLTNFYDQLAELTEALVQNKYEAVDALVFKMSDPVISSTFKHLGSALKMVPQFQTIEKFRTAFKILAKYMDQHPRSISKVINARAMFMEMSSV